MTTPKPSPSRMVLILGAHRSGTSALAGVIQRLGINLGDHLIGPQKGVNERGFWEHRDLVALHDRLLDRLGSRWDSARQLPEHWWKSADIEPVEDEIKGILERDFSKSGLSGIKDPRLCRLLPLWLKILGQRNCDPAAIIIYRHPLEVAASLTHRDQMDTGRALTVWLLHMLDAEYYSRDIPRVIISYTDLLNDWRSTVQQISTGLALRFPLDIDTAGSQIDQFIEGSLQHHRHSDTDLASQPELSAWISEIYAALRDAGKHGDETTRSRFDDVRNSLISASSLFDPLIQSDEKKIREIEDGFTRACEIIEEQKKANAGFSNAVEMLNRKEAELAATRALLTPSVRALAEVLDEWEIEDTDTPVTVSPLEEDDKTYDGVIDLGVTNNSHTQLFNFIQEHSGGRKLRILEAGCSSGYFGVALKDAGHEVWGVEMTPNAASIARQRLDHVFVGTIEEFLACDAVRGVKFDYITFGDVLEHLTDPQKTLEDCRKILSPEGAVAASIPNVAHKAVRLMLLEGRWDYAKFGILDDTHMRFFTRKTVVDTFTHAGYEIQRMESVDLPVSQTGIDVDPEIQQLASSLIKDDDQEVFQFTVLATKSDAVTDIAKRNALFRQGTGQKKILCLLPIPDWSVGNIRIRNPLQKYRQLYGGQVRIRSLFDHQYDDLVWADTVILQRESNKDILGLVGSLQRMGKRIIFDLDDLLTEVPEFLQCYNHSKQIRPYLQEALRMADAVTVSTDRLKDEMDTYNAHVFVVPNCARAENLSPKRHSDDTDRVYLLVASTDTVRVDFVVKALKRLVADTELNIEIVAIGPPGEFLQSAGLAVHRHENMSYEGFRNFLSGRENTIGVIPLDDSRFSNCKSPIKFLDFSLAGIPAVCSDVPPYSDIITDGVNGLLCGDQEDDWYNAVRKLALSASLRNRIADAGRKLSEAEYSMQHAADSWNHVFNTTKAGQGKAGSRLITSSRHISSLAQRIITPANYRSLIRVFRTEGIRGVKSRLARYL